MRVVNTVDRIHVSSGQLVVPPFDCAWLSDSESQIRNEQGCIVFEVLGETDATVILKTKPGSGRLQQRSYQRSRQNSHEESYLVIFGSHRNTLLRIEKNGFERASFKNSWSRISAHSFQKFWICYIFGTIYIGTGDPSYNYQAKWEDSQPLHGIQYIGLSAWDKHCTFRRIRVEPCVPQLKSGNEAPSLFDIVVSTILTNLDIEKACVLLLSVDRYDIPDAEQLRKRASTFLAKNFVQFIRDYQDVFSILSSNTVCSLLRSPELSADERLVFNSVASWIFNGDALQIKNQERSSEEISEVLKWVRFTIIDPDDLKEMLASPLARQFHEVAQTIEHALEIQSHASDSDVNLMPGGPVVGNRKFFQNKMEIDFFWKRAIPDSVQLQYSYDGDKKGVCNYLGKDCGVKPWKNPMTIKMLTVKASSPSNRFTSPKDIVGEKFLRTNFAGPKRMNHKLVTYWLIDLQDRTLICNYYTVRHDASYDFVRFWDFQGSDDNEKWTSLRKHEHDCTINAPGCRGSWPIYCNAKPYRMFRLLLTRPTESITTPNNMPLSNLELYGTLISSSSS